MPKDLNKTIPKIRKRKDMPPRAISIPPKQISKRKRGSLSKKDAILDSISFAANRFLRTKDWDRTIQEVLSRLGQATGVSRVYIFEFHAGEDGTLLTSQRYEWVASGIIPQIDNPQLQGFSLRKNGFERWEEMLGRGQVIQGLVKDFPESERNVLSAQDIQSIVVVPIFVEQAWWGFIGFDECQTERQWSEEEVDVLKTAAGILGAAIQHKKAEEALRRSEEAARERNENIYRFQKTLLNLAKEKITDLPTTFQRITEVDSQILGVERVSIWLFNEDHSEMLCEDLYRLSQNVHEKGFRLKAQQFPNYFLALEEDRAIAAVDARTDSRTKEFTEEYLKPNDIFSLLDVPIRLHEKVLGVVCHEQTGAKKEWTLEEQEFAASIADMVSLALESFARSKTEEALRKSEEKYRTILESIEDGYFEVNLAGDLTFFNESLCRILGYSREELMGMGNRQYTDEENRKKLYEAFNKVYRTGQPTKAFAWEVIRKDGVRRCGEVSITLMKNSEGQPIGFRGIARDVTERKQAEELLKETQEKFRFLAENMADIVWTTDLNFHTTYVSPSIEKILGFTPEERMRQPLNQMVTPASLKKIRDLFGEEVQRLKDTKDLDPDRSMIVEVEYYHKDGSTIWMENTIKPMFDPSGKWVGIYGVSRDITERKRTEEALKESEEKYRSIFDNAVEGIYRSSIEGRFLTVNPAMARIFGYESPAQMINSITDISKQFYVDPVQRQTFIQALEGEAGNVLGFEYEAYRKDGSKIWISDSARLVFGPDGALLFLEGFIEDITNRKQAEKTLQTERERFKSLSENAPFGMAMIGKEGTFQYINPKFKEMFGYDLEDIPDGRTWFRKAYPDPEYRHQVISAWLDDLESSKPGEKRSRIFSVRCKDGTEKIINFIPVQLETGENLMACEDITERKKAEEALLKSEEESKKLARGNAVMAEIGRIISSTLDIEEIYERFAEEVHKLIPFDRLSVNLINFKENIVTVAYTFGLDVPDRRVGDTFPFAGSASEHIVRTRESLLVLIKDEGDIQKVGGRFPALLSNLEEGIRSTMTVPLISKDQIFGVLHFRSLKMDAYTEVDLRLAERIGNQIAGAIANSLLFKERLQAEKSLKETQEALSMVLDSVDMDIYIGDLKTYEILFMNKHMKDSFGHDLVGKICWQAFMNGSGPCSHCTNDKLLGPDSQPTGVYIWENYNPITNRWYVNHDCAVRWIDGRFVRLQVAIDTTELKNAEQEKTALQEQLRQSQKMEAIGQLAGGIAHDFNNLLTVIKGYTELSLLGLNEGDPLKENIREIYKASDRAANLTRQLLAFSRRQMMEMKVVDPNALLKDLDKMLRRVIGEDVELIYKLAENVGKVKADPGQIEQVIMNLAVNARDAMPRGGRLTIETANVVLGEGYIRTHIGVTPGHYVMICVSDTGVGITPEIKERIFDPFFTTKERGKGTGLGLPVAYGIIKQSGGDIEVFSEPGKGTTFKIYLGEVDQPLDHLEKPTEISDLPRGSETILVVEDEEEVRKMAVRILSAQGYRILEAPNGLEALRIQKEEKDVIHLLLTDVVMPQMGGKELADRLIPLRPKIKVLFMSGYTDDAIVKHGVLDPGVHLLQKPFSPEGLARKVREVLDR